MYVVNQTVAFLRTILCNMILASHSFSTLGAGHTYSTLPRPRTETKTLSDYEREIHGLRSAMETLQVSN